MVFRVLITLVFHLLHVLGGCLDIIRLLGCCYAIGRHSESSKWLLGYFE